MKLRLQLWRAVHATVGRSESDVGFAGYEVLVFVLLVVLFFVPLVIGTLRLLDDKLYLDQLAYDTARIEVISLRPGGVAEPPSVQTQDRFGDPTTVTVTGALTGCSTITAAAHTALPVIVLPLIGTVLTVQMTSLSTLPTDAYLVPDQGGIACAS